MAKEVRIQLTAAQKAKIKSATGKEMAEIRVARLGKNLAVSPATGLSAKDMSIKAQDMSISAHDMSIKAQDMSIKAQDLTSQDLTSQDLTSQDLTSQDLTSQDLSGGPVKQ
jgi:hypothetical protein